MEQVFSYIISLGASVMMPIIFTVIGLCIGMKFGKALKSGLFVGVGFVGLGVVTALLTTNFNDPLKAISDIYHLQLNVFDMGWPAAAAVAYNTAVGALIIPICLGVNFLMLVINRGKESGRSDDNEETIKKRLNVYHTQTAPLIDWYEKEGIHHHIEGLGTVDEIFARVCNVIDNL